MQLSRHLALLAGGLALAAPFAGQAQGPGISPGQYQITSTIVSVDMPGVLPQVAQMMANKTATTSICITPDMAAKGQTAKPPGDCTMGPVSMAGGKISSSMTCNMSGQVMTTTTSGSYMPDSFETTGTVAMTGKTSMTETVKVSAKRVGDCK